MDFEQLRTFQLVSRLKSFSRAASQLGITQPAISAQIRSLETEVGARLFDREGGKVSMTAAGRLFEPFAEHCLQCQSHIFAGISELYRSPRGVLSVSTSEAASLYVLPQVFAEFKKLYSRVQLSIVRAERTRTLESIVNREVDFGIVSLPVRDNRLMVHAIHRDEVVLVAPASHPLALTSSVELDQIMQFPLLMTRQGSQRQKIDQFFQSKDARPRIAMELESSELLKRLIAAGIGVGFLPQANVAHDVAAGELKTVRVSGMHVYRELGLICLKDKRLTRAEHAFLEVATRGTAGPETGTKPKPHSA
ncbi:LysR substrate-binding domain-containing protein [Acidicapsa dinghuensis]|uniref:LysR substrate-binding domain-containing protein n=1 Tax=Acidicapsa dinghuensis TaxID=2218256 RepID=A0ABW1EM21_9BACT|nr:LysR family transcriptional regulator [Acidicapsa dinghuensis]